MGAPRPPPPEVERDPRPQVRLCAATTLHRTARKVGTDFQQSSVEVCPSPAAGREATSMQHPCGVCEEGPSLLRSPRPVICVTRNTADASQ